MKENNIIDSSSDDVAKKVVEYLRKSEEKKAVSENTWIIKGFYELHRGNYWLFIILKSEYCNLIFNCRRE